MKLKIYKTKVEYDWWYILPTIEIKHKYWYLWQIMFSWLCWSLAALLDVLPQKYYPIKDHETNLILGKPKDKWCALYWDAMGMQDGEQTLGDSPVDACVAMIEKLNELKRL